ncbi:GNAT family N-acetyltransferase [Aeromicrobium sp.]|uniref:GNAT family N-acetyltransferase n=1 Tax=Aeromicrobium sp. TaxID=1871063 RepID=UPI003C56AA37
MSKQVVHNTDEKRYEINVDGALAGFTDALEDDGIVTFPHTVVFDGYEGQGLASVLVSEALDDVRQRNKKIVPECSYVAQFVDEHPDYADLVA